MAQLVQRWLGYVPNEKQVKALERKYHTKARLESELCRIIMHDDEDCRWCNIFIAWLENYK